MKPENRSKIITIEGNIGSGKSTLLKLIQEKVNHTQIVPEPLTQWQAINGDTNLNLLEIFYNDPKRWGYTFQSYAYFTRIKQWSDINPVEKYVVAERSVLSDKHIFAMNAKKSGLFNEIEWALYEEYFNWLTQQFQANQVDGIIYLNTKAEECHKRLLRRGREEEKTTISLDYLQSLEDRHEEWLGEKENIPYPVLLVDGQGDYTKPGARQEEIVDSIANWINQL